MKKTWLAVIAVVAVALAVSLIALPRGSEWTTDSPEARVELEAAVDAQMKLYHPEAKAHLEKAVELDPDFVVAKLFLADQLSRTDRERAKQLADEAFAADVSRLSARERLLIERARAIGERRYDDAARMTDDYLEKHRDDPYVLHLKALRTWLAGDFEEAERLNQRLIEIAPNWVIAYNQLGYIAMSQGRFVEAEEYFSSYRFVAPDQANPHDSLGELYMITGRYDEAEATLLRSIEIKPDFWAAYDHLVLVKTWSGDFDGARQVLEMARDTGDCPPSWDAGMECRILLSQMAASALWRDILAARDEHPECFNDMASGYARVVTHLAASTVGDRDVAQAIEDDVAKLVASAQEGTAESGLGDVLGLQAHLRGVRLAVNGDLEGAIESFNQADRHLSYLQAGSGLFKLYNRILLVETLLAAGDDGKAHQLLSKVRSVNPKMADEFEERGFKVLGLER
jgi:Flp pilus assembly protein TadD